MDHDRGARRTVRCGLHGRFYDAWSPAGCPDCASGGPAFRSRRHAGVAAALLLLAGAAGLAIWQGGLPLANTTRAERTRIETTRAEPAPPVRLEFAALERFAETLGPLLAEGRGEPLPIGWELRVYNACASPPAAPAPADTHGATAHQLLGDACHELRAAVIPPADSPVPAETWRQQVLDQASAKLAAARAELDEAARL